MIFPGSILNYVFSSVCKDWRKCWLGYSSPSLCICMCVCMKFCGWVLLMGVLIPLLPGELKAKPWAWLLFPMGCSGQRIFHFPFFFCQITFRLLLLEIWLLRNPPPKLTFLIRTEFCTIQFHTWNGVLFSYLYSKPPNIKFCFYIVFFYWSSGFFIIRNSI